MKKLLLLAFIAVSCEAVAQDSQCVAERAAMVEKLFEPMHDPRPLFWDRKAYLSASWRLWGKRNGIGSSPGVLAQ